MLNVKSLKKIKFQLSSYRMTRLDLINMVTQKVQKI